MSGLVFLLNRDTVYFRDFEYNVDLSELSSRKIDCCAGSDSCSMETLCLYVYYNIITLSKL